MTHTKSFAELTFKDTPIAGGKGASLGEMTQAGIPVPPGFVVLAGAFEHFLQETDLGVEIDAILHTVNHQEIHTVEYASEKIQALIGGAVMPTDIQNEILASFDTLGASLVAVRSSATSEDSHDAAWAGQLDSHMNIERGNVVHVVQECWASLFTPRAIFYRFEKDLHTTKISVAVVIQKMVASDVSGIAFSVHPVTEDRNQIIIEAGWGFGDAVVSGSITPDSYVVEKEPRNILDVNVSIQSRRLVRRHPDEAPDEEWGENVWKEVPAELQEKQKLSNTDINNLSDIVIRIENHYGFPCDIEWAKEGETFYITQSRPITTLSKKTSEERSPILEEVKSKRFECIVRFPRIPVLCAEAMGGGFLKNPYFNLADAPPDPSTVLFIGDGLEGWVGKSGRVSISSRDAIKKIEEASLECIPRNRIVFETITNTSTQELADPARLVELIEKANYASVDTYKHFMFFIDESFKTSDKVLAEQLQKTRLELDTLLNRYLFPAFEKLLQALVTSHQFSREIAEQATTAEIISILKNPKKLKECAVLQSRPVAFVLLNERVEVLVGAEAKEIQRYLVEQDPDKKILEEVSKNDIIRGVAGNGGVVKGRVRKLHAREFNDKDKLESLSKDKDFILVVSMTSPELVPYFEHALAFVTDEGGITCHAAIIARELGKPCIIGTKVATQILNDGDLVEVDADNGVVRILKSNSKAEEILATKWHHLGKWIEPALAAEVWLEYASVAQQFFAQKLDGKILYLNGDFFLSQHDSDIFQNESYEAAKNHTKAFFETIYATVKDVAAKLVDEVAMTDSVSGFLEKYKELTGVWMPLNNIAAGIEKYVQEVNPAAFGLAVGYVDEKPWTLQQIDEMKSLSLSDEVAIKNHVEKYQWLGTHHFNINELTVEGLHERIKQEETKTSADKDVSQVLDEETAYLVWLLNVIGYARFRAAETSGYTTFHFKKHLEALAQKHGLTYEDIVEHTMAEIASDSITKQTARTRKEHTGFYFDGDEHILSKEDVVKCLAALIKTESNDTTQVKGLCAQVGKATGKVKIVTRQDQMDGFEEGMVLVAYETTPDIIFAMQKCSAIVTDFGGLTSHAAIVARELKKPCIVGTKNATKVFKDGDMVEVDADAGVVRIVD